MKKIIKTLGAVAILGTVAMASNVTSSTLTVEALNMTKESSLSTDTSWYCDPIERIMNMCRSTQPLLPEN